MCDILFVLFLFLRHHKLSVAEKVTTIRMKQSSEEALRILLLIFLLLCHNQSRNMRLQMF